MTIHRRTPALATIAAVLVACNVAAQTPATQADRRGPDSPYSIRASDVIGATVVNGENVELGTVDDIVIMRPSGELHAVISVGGILGIGDALYAVRFDDLKAGSDGDRVFLDMSRSALVERPRFRYVEGELEGQRIWEKRLAVKRRLDEKRKDVDEEREDILDLKKQIRDLERQLDELKRQ